ncbi:unnamed protein product [Adineta steineri]|uniref:Cytochrome P450 n=1 Tax=Adineta steineri TaxID=433720 RepID=A0A815SIX1_9BILA|nr:unnamed protein product [Adineta steineri]CAF1490387.1 unnamed protein product [Adineta steineri]
MFLTLFLLVILLILYHQIRSFRYFSSRSVPGPHTSLFFGNLRQLWNCQSISRQLQLWTNKFGPIYGLYEGARQRVWIVSDVKFLEDVFIKQYSHFTSRKPIAIFLNPNEKYPSLLNAKTEKWKRQRKVMNTIFSTIKLKDLFPYMNSCVTHFLFKLSTTGSSDINIYTFYKRLTFDIICSCCYGLDTSSEEYYQKVEEIFAIDVTQSLWVKLTCLLGSTSFLSQLIEKLYRSQDDFKRFLNGKQNFFQFGEFPRYWIREKVREIVDLGIKSRDDDEKIDLVHLLLKATDKNFTQCCTKHSSFTLRLLPLIFLDDIVQADVYSLHYSLDLWGPTDPDVFYPDRHITQKSQSAFLGFGLGPRQCIGMRFAMSIIKLTLIRLLKKYTVVHSNKLEENWCLQDKRVITPQSCWIRLEARQ